MPRILKDNYIITYLKKVSLLHRLLFFLIVLTGFGCIWFYSFYNPYYCYIALIKQRCQAIEKENTAFVHTLKDFDHYKKENIDLTQKLEQLAFDSHFQMDGLELLLYKAQEHRLTTKRIEPIKSKKALHQTSKYYTVHLCADFEQIATFLNDVSSILAPVLYHETELIRSVNGLVDLILRIECIQYKQSFFDSKMTFSRV